MSRGEKESRCLERVRDALFYRNGAPICSFLNGHSCFEVDDAAFKKEHIFYCNSEFNKTYFGLLEEDRIEFANAIRTAIPNPSSNEFPDFIFGDGFIEHFQITSSQVTRKGATHARKESDFQHKVDVEREKLEAEWSDKPCFDKVRSKSWTFQNPAHSHAFLKDSFERNWQHHLESREKYSGKKDVGIFMVEYPEISLAMCENVYGNWIEGMSSGDMREQEEFKDYRLSRDKVLLDYIYSFRTVIKYVIFVNPVRCEVVQTENIPHLLHLMPWDYAIYPMQVCTIASTHNISVANPFAKGDESNDKTQ
jgi:hypothetical protein